MIRHTQILLLLLLVVGGCSMDPLVYRIGSDYIPMDAVGNTWSYNLSSGGEKLVSVAGSSIMLRRDCMRVQVNLQDGYWYKGEDYFDEYVKTTYLFNEEFVLEERWARRLALPLVLGNTWADEFENTIMVYGEPVKRSVTLDGKVVAIRDVSVPAGRFDQCYVVRLEQVGVIDTPYGNGSVDSTFVEEYYAPDIGLIKRVNLLTLEKEELRDYSLK